MHATQLLPDGNARDRLWSGANMMQKAWLPHSRLALRATARYHIQRRPYVELVCPPDQCVQVGRSGARGLQVGAPEMLGGAGKWGREA